MKENREWQYRQLKLAISYFRKLQGMTQQELADAVHVSRTHISNIEAPEGKISISLDCLFDIADALDVPVMEFFRFHHDFPSK